ncbi:hypothetical protein JS565_12765 [Salmonella enterica subsp. enterica serovar Senftenberg]|nr:hypothetical protein [Salmonella enterica subsp. enterica serovar Senftenberg]
MITELTGYTIPVFPAPAGINRNAVLHTLYRARVPAPAGINRECMDLEEELAVFPRQRG